jgi:glycerate 2-kinase
MGASLMKIIIAPDKFKGSMSAAKAAESIARGIKSVMPAAQLQLIPLSDGGEGLIDSLVGSAKGTLMHSVVADPLGSPVKAAWGLLDDGKTAVIEMSTASGLTLVPEEKRNPSIATTYGTGELIKAALDHGCTRLIIGIGGSATSDGGAGMAQALGARFYDQHGQMLNYGGAELLRLDRIDVSALDNRLQSLTTLVACDVDNPLNGPLGASRIYGPQKGASPELVDTLDAALSNYAQVVKKDLGVKIDNVPGAGAAGGLGAGLIAFLGAELRSGIELVLDALQIDQLLPGCSLLITAEGKLDAQSAHGKAPVGIARRAARFGVPVIALAGSIESDLEQFHSEGLSACFAIADGPLTLEQSIARGPELLKNKTAELLRLWRIASSAIR